MTTESKWPYIVLLGHVIQEMIYFPDRTIGPVLGSPVAYGALVAARLGEHVGIVSAVGDDLPAQLLAPLRDAGVDLSGVRHVSGSFTTRTELIYDEAGNKTIRYPQKAPPLRVKDVPQSYLNAAIYYIATMDRDVPAEMIAYLARQHGQIAIDLGGYGGAHSPRTPGVISTPDLHVLQEIISHVNLVRASVEDCQFIFGLKDMYQHDEQAAILQRLLKWGPTLAMLTLGAEGCVVATGDSIIRYPAFSGHVIDTTGAGDSFFTAFLVEYMHTGDMQASVRFAGATVIQVIEHTGGVHLERMPTRKKVLERLEAGIAV